MKCAPLFCTGLSLICVSLGCVKKTDGFTNPE